MSKKFLIGTLAVVAFVVTANLALASYDFGSATLKVGSRGQYVTTLQNLVGATPVDGVFGPKTKAKVVAWQAANGLTADGLFGKLSKAKTNETGTNFGAGCTNASGFSTTTGLPCSSLNANTFSAGCTNASGFSTTTGLACISLSAHTFPAGCMNASGFSTTTGYSCLTGLLATTTPIVRGGGGGSSHHSVSPTAVFGTPTYDGEAHTLTIYGTLSEDATATVKAVSLKNIDGTEIGTPDITAQLAHFAPGFTYGETWTNARLIEGVLAIGVNADSLATLAPGLDTVMVTFTFTDAAGNTKDANFTWVMGDTTAPTVIVTASGHGEFTVTPSEKLSLFGSTDSMGGSGLYIALGSGGTSITKVYRMLNEVKDDFVTTGAVAIAKAYSDISGVTSNGHLLTDNIDAWVTAGYTCYVSTIEGATVLTFVKVSAGGVISIAQDVREYNADEGTTVVPYTATDLAGNTTTFTPQ